MMRLTPSRFMGALLLVAAAIMLQAPEALAAGDDLSTLGFTCIGGTTAGRLFASGSACPTTLSMDNVFSFLVCNFEQLSANVMGQLYCGMIQNLAPAVMAAVALATSLYGVMFLFGMIPATGQEAMKFILKCAFVVAFATNADYLIGIAYKGALGAISTGSSIVIGLMSVDGVTSGAGVYSQLDGFLSKFFHSATDYMINPATATPNTEMCNNALFAVLGTMFVVFPFFAYMGLMLVVRILMTFFRAVFAYIYAIVGITFILLLAPFFVVFAMFRLTSTLFERWLGYLVSFALQVVLLFSFLAFIFSMHLENNAVVTNLTSIIMYKSEQAEATTFRLPFSYCTICIFKVVNSDTGVDMTDKDPDYIAKGKLVCKDHTADAIKPEGTVAATGFAPVRPTFATSPDSKGELGTLLRFAGNGILSLIILALIIEHLLKLIPSLAQKLASSMNATYATQLGGGGAMDPRTGEYRSLGAGIPTTEMPGSSIINRFGDGFERGFASVGGRHGLEGNSISAGAKGLQEGTSAASEGIGGAFGDYLTDPSKFGR